MTDKELIFDFLSYNYYICVENRNNIGNNQFTIRDKNDYNLVNFQSLYKILYDTFGYFKKDTCSDNIKDEPTIRYLNQWFEEEKISVIQFITNYFNNLKEDEYYYNFIEKFKECEQYNQYTNNFLFIFYKDQYFSEFIKPRLNKIIEYFDKTKTSKDLISMTLKLNYRNDFESRVNNYLNIWYYNTILNDKIKKFLSELYLEPNFCIYRNGSKFNGIEEMVKIMNESDYHYYTIRTEFYCWHTSAVKDKENKMKIYRKKFLTS